MGYFALLSESPGDLDVVRCHLNLWVLPGLFWRRVFFLDVGLGLRVKNVTPATPPKPFKIALPFGVADNGCVDISERLLTNSNTAMLVFGQHVEVSRKGNAGELKYDNRKTITRKRANFSLSEIARDADGISAASVSIEHADDDTLQVVEETLKVVRTTATKDEVASTDNASLYVIELPANVATDAEVYVRLRFRVSSHARMWLPSASGNLLDLRVADVREVVQEAAWRNVKGDVVPIKKLNAFVIVPCAMQSRAASPAPKYVRALEGSLWESYLGRRIAFIGDDKMFIYYWKAENVDDKEPFRLFLDLQSAQWNFWTGAFIGVVVAMSWPGVIAKVKALPSFATLSELVVSLVALVSAFSAYGIVKFLFPKVGAWLYGVLRNWKGLRKTLLAVEDKVYSWRLKRPEE